MTDAVKEYESALKDLTFNSKPLINMLTMLAEESIAHAPEIVKLIEAKLLKNEPTKKLCVFYLLDSMIKNMKGLYLQLFTENIVNIFSSVFEQVDEKTRLSLFKLRSTWKDFFPVKKLYAIDMKVKQLDPAWPVIAAADPKPKPAPQPSPTSTAIHINPKFIKKTGTEPAPATSSAASTKQLSESERQEAEMRQQVIAKQQQLLQLEQQRLEFELQQTKAKLEEQAKELELKNAQLVKQQSQQFIMQKQQVPGAPASSAAAPPSSWPAAAVAATPMSTPSASMPLSLPSQMPTTTTTSSRDPRLASSRDPRLASRDPRVRAAAEASATSPVPVVPPAQPTLPPPPQQPIPMPPQQPLPPPPAQPLPPPPTPPMQPTVPLQLPSSQPVPQGPALLLQPPLPPPNLMQGLPPAMPMPPQPIPQHVLAQLPNPAVPFGVNQWPMQQPPPFTQPEQPPLPPPPTSVLPQPKPPEPTKETTDPRKKQPSKKETKGNADKKKQDPKVDKTKSTSKTDVKDTKKDNNKNRPDVKQDNHDNKAKSGKGKSSESDEGEEVVEIKSVKKTDAKKSTWPDKNKDTKKGSLSRIPKRRSTRSRSRSPHSRSRSRSRSPHSRSPRGSNRRDRRDRDRPKDWDRDNNTAKGKDKAKSTKDKGAEKPNAKSSPKPKTKSKKETEKEESVKRSRKSSKEDEKTSDESAKESDSSSKQRKTTQDKADKRGSSLEKESTASKRQKLEQDDSDGSSTWGKKVRNNNNKNDSRAGPSEERASSPSSKRCRSSINPNVKIPKELSLEKHSVILAQADKQLKSGELSHEQHQQLLKQFSELYQFQKMRVQEAYEKERAPAAAAQDRPADPRFMAMVKEMEGGRRKSDSDDRSGGLMLPARDVDMRMMDPTRLPPVDQDERQRPTGDVDLRPKMPVIDTNMRQSGSDQDERTLPLSGDRDERPLKGRDRDERIKPDRDDRPPVIAGRDKDDRRREMISGRDQDERLPRHRGEPHRTILLDRPPRRPDVSEPGRPGPHPEEPSNLRAPPMSREPDRLKPDNGRRGRGGRGDRPLALTREEPALPANLMHRPPSHEFETRNRDLPPRLDKEDLPLRGAAPLMQRYEDRDRRRAGWQDRRGPGPESDRKGPRPLDRRGPGGPESDRRGPAPDRRGPCPESDRRGGPGPDRRGPGPESDRRGLGPEAFDRDDRPRGRRGGPPEFMGPGGPEDFDDRGFGPPGDRRHPREPRDSRDRRHPRDARDRGPPPDFDDRGPRGRPHRLPPDHPDFQHGPPGGLPGRPPRGKPDGPPDMIPLTPDALKDILPEIIARQKSKTNVPLVSHQQLETLVNELPPQILAQLTGDPSSSPGNPDSPNFNPALLEQLAQHFNQITKRGDGPPGELGPGMQPMMGPGHPGMRPHGLPSLLEMEIRPRMMEQRPPFPGGPPEHMMRGPHPGGPDIRGPIPGGFEMRGPHPDGSEMREPHPGGPELQGPHPGGPEMRGPHPGGPIPGGMEIRGPVPGGHDIRGPHSGQMMQRPVPGGPDIRGPIPGGPDFPGPGPAPGGLMHMVPGQMIQEGPGMGPGPARPGMPPQQPPPPDVPGMPPHFAAQLQKPNGRESPQPQLQNQLDINSLFSKLLQMGIISDVRVDSPQNVPPASEAPPSSAAETGVPTTMGEDSQDSQTLDMDNLKITMEPCTPEEMHIPKIALESDELKVRQPGVIRRIYCGTQCLSCGMRFVIDERDRYHKHLDWHFRQNQKKQDTTHKVVSSREWFYVLNDWMKFEEMNEEEAKSELFEAMVQEKTQIIDKDGVSSVAMDKDEENNDICKICHEPFEQYWDEDEEMWLLKDALRHKGKTYHPMCYEDAVENYGGVDTLFDHVPSTPFMRTPRSSLDNSFKSPTTEKTPTEKEEKPTDADPFLKPALTSSQETLFVSSSEESSIDSDASGQKKLVMDIKKEDASQLQEPGVKEETVKPDPGIAVAVKSETSDEPPVPMEDVKTEPLDEPPDPTEGLKEEAEKTVDDKSPQSPTMEDDIKEKLLSVTQEQMQFSEIPGLGSGIPGLTLSSESVQQEDNVTVEDKVEIDERTKSDTEQIKSEATEIEKMDTKVTSEPEMADTALSSSEPTSQIGSQLAEISSEAIKTQVSSEPTHPQISSEPTQPQISSEPTPPNTSSPLVPPQTSTEVALVLSRPKWRAATEWGAPRKVTWRSVPIDVRLSREDSSKGSPAPPTEVQSSNQGNVETPVPLGGVKEDQPVPSAKSETTESSGDMNGQSVTASGDHKSGEAPSSDAQNQAEAGDSNKEAVNLPSNVPENFADMNTEGEMPAPMQTDSMQGTPQDVAAQLGELKQEAEPDVVKPTVEHSPSESPKQDESSASLQESENPAVDDKEPPCTPLMDEPEEPTDPVAEPEKEEKPRTPPGTSLMDEPAEKVGDAPPHVPPVSQESKAAVTTSASQEMQGSDQKQEETEGKDSKELTSGEHATESKPPETEPAWQEGSKLEQQPVPSTTAVQDHPSEAEEPQSIAVVGRPRHHGYSIPRRGGSPRRDEYMPQAGFDQSRRGRNHMQRGDDQLRRGHDHSQRGHDQMRRGHNQMRRGHDQMRRGHDQMRRGHDQMRRGHDQMRRGHDQSRRGHNQFQRSHYRGRGGHQGFDPHPDFYHPPNPNQPEFGRGRGRGRGQGRGRGRGRGNWDSSHGTNQPIGSSPPHRNVNFADDDSF